MLANVPSTLHRLKRTKDTLARLQGVLSSFTVNSDTPSRQHLLRTLDGWITSLHSDTTMLVIALKRLHKELASELGHGIETDTQSIAISRPIRHNTPIKSSWTHIGGGNSTR